MKPLLTGHFEKGLEQFERPIFDKVASLVTHALLSISGSGECFFNYKPTPPGLGRLISVNLGRLTTLFRLLTSVLVN